MNNEDILIKEILEATSDDFDLNKTTCLKKVYDKGNIESIVNELRSGTKPNIFKFIKFQFTEINEQYEDFLTNSNIRRKRFSRRLIKNSSNFREVHKQEATGSYYHKVVGGLYSLYDKKNNHWLRDLVDLKTLLQDMNNKDSHRCLLCQSQLHEVDIEKDHFLPRSIFPTLSISGQNFTSICKTCNGKSHKGDRVPNLPIIIPNKCKTSPVEDCFQFKFIKKGGAEFGVLKDELERLGVTISTDQEYLSDVLPKDCLDEYQKMQVNNLIELFILKKRFNTNDFYAEISKDIELLKSEISANTHVLKRKNIEELFDDELSRILRRLDTKGTNEIHRKFRREMLEQYIENVKGVLILEILNELKKINNEEQQ